MFTGYLNQTELQELILAAVNGGVVSLDRSIRMTAIHKTFVLGMQRPPSASDLEQFNLDLVVFNGVERLLGGQVPLEVFLQNIAFQLKLRARPEAEVFERYANLVRNRASGVVGLPDPSKIPEVQRKEAIVGMNDMVAFEFLAAGLEAGRSVARLLVPRFENDLAVMDDNGAPWVMQGTGWMIGPDLLITNHHVVNARRDGENDASAADFDRQGREAAVEFDYDNGKTPVATGVQAVVASSPELDYAILRLGSGTGRPPLRLAREPVVVKATTYLSVNIIQHPRGMLKQVAFRNNLVSGADRDTVRYFTDTDYGSSGSPVFNDEWKVVALHRGARHAGNVSYQGKSTAFVNYGSQIPSILGDLEKKDTAAHASIEKAVKATPASDSTPQPGSG